MEVLKSSYGGGRGEVGEATKGGADFYGWELTPLDTVLLVQKYRGLPPNTFYRLEAYDNN